MNFFSKQETIEPILEPKKYLTTGSIRIVKKIYSYGTFYQIEILSEGGMGMEWHYLNEEYVTLEEAKQGLIEYNQKCEEPISKETVYEDLYYSNGEWPYKKFK